MVSLASRVTLTGVLLATAAFAGTPVTYHLGSESNYVIGCFPPCYCPVKFHDNLTGTLRLTPLAPTPDWFDHYLVSDVDWTLELGGDLLQVTGSGQYDIGGPVALTHRLQLDLSLEGGPVQHFDSGLIAGGFRFPLIEISISLNGQVCLDEVYGVSAAPLFAASSSFCNGFDGSHAACPCTNFGTPDTGCDIPQATGGVRLDAIAQTVGPNGATLRGSGFPVVGSPAAIVIRSTSLDPASPVVFGDGLRCVSSASLVRLAATSAAGGVSTHTLGHGPAAGSGDFYYQLWLRSNPATFCDPLAAYNLSNGRTLSWP